MKVFARSMTALFCETARTELGGQTSLIGIYGKRLHVDAFPHYFPVLTVQLTGSFDVEQPLQSFNLRVLVGDDEVESHPAPDDFFEKAIVRAKAQQRAAAGINTNLRMIGLELSEACDIKVVATVDGEEYLINVLQIRGREAASPRP